MQSAKEQFLKMFLDNHPGTAREKARMILDQTLVHVLGLSIDDLPDSSQICQIIDDLEEAITNEELERVGEILIENMTMDKVMELVFS